MNGAAVLANYLGEAESDLRREYQPCCLTIPMHRAPSACRRPVYDSAMLKTISPSHVLLGFATECLPGRH
ncbi:hypothetical protein KCP74_12215 [Salmonella enterica subsp. enterica]|nr:hypothetical protein KCP74_12215 [Salmonella enterica subsp. enterica]